MVINYFGELGGMVGSMETMAPSGSTIMMALFLSTTKHSQMEQEERENIKQIIIITISGELNLYNINNKK